MLINEIFSSIDGEGIRTGFPVTFIRTYGCNLLCSYCDTLYAVDPQTEEDKQNAFTSMGIDEIVEKCKELKNRRITFTGGEPLIQKDAAYLVNKLLDEGFEVNIETNGAVNIEEFDVKIASKNLFNLIYTLDYKTASSGMEDKMILSNLEYIGTEDVLKFVVGSREDLDKMKEIVTNYDIEAEIFVSPVFGKIEPRELVEYVLENDLQNVRVQLQLHKIIWNPETRGV